MTFDDDLNPPLPDTPDPHAGEAPTTAQPHSQTKPTNGLAIVALIASFFVGLAGVICGIISLSQLKRTGQNGRGLAVAGIVVGAVQTVVMVIVMIAVIAAAAVVGTTASVARSLDALPTPGESSATQECADLNERMAEGAAALRSAADNAATDPQSAVQALTDFTSELRDASEEISDPEVEAAVTEGITGLDDFTTYLAGVAADPAAAAAAPDAQSQMFDRLTALQKSLQGISTACAATP